MIEVTAPAGREVHLASTDGCVVHLSRSETRKVPAFLGSLAAEKGCTVRPLDSKTTVEDVTKPELSTDERAAAIKDVVKLLIDRGDPNDFTPQGKLKKAAVEKHVDFKTTSSEVNDIYDAVLDEETTPGE